MWECLNASCPPAVAYTLPSCDVLSHVQLLARFEQDKLAPWEGTPVARRAMLRYVQSAMA